MTEASLSRVLNKLPCLHVESDNDVGVLLVHASFDSLGAACLRCYAKRGSSRF